MPAKQTAFVGFPDAKLKPIAVPELFFSDLLPLIDDLAELKLTLHCFWPVSRDTASAAESTPSFM